MAGPPTEKDSAEPRPLFQLPITPALAISIGLLVFLSGALVLGLQWFVSRENTLDLTNDISTLVIDRIEADLRNHLNPAASQALYLGERITSGEYPLSDRPRLTALLTGALSAAPQINAVALWDRSLWRLVVARDPKGGVIVEEHDDSEDPKVQEAARTLERVVAPFWGELILTRLGVTLINLRYPLRQGDELIGFLAAVITVPQLSELVTEAGDVFGGTAFVLYGRNKVLAHPNLASLAPRATDAPEAEGAPREPGTPLLEVGDPVLSKLWEAQPVAEFRKAQEREVNVVEITIGDQAYYAIYKWTREFGETPWVTGAWFPKDEISMQIERLRVAAIIGLAVVLLSIVAAILLGRAIARPIRKAALGSAQIGELDLEHVEPLETSMVTELNDQSRAFNTMLHSLRAFEAYVPKALVRRLMRQSGVDSGLADEERELTVLFTDIVGFATLSEKQPASRIAAFLNEHFALLGRCVEDEGGTIDKYIGDALMAFWGAPERQRDTARPACRAALAIARAIFQDNARRQREGLPPIRLRIGIHTGQVVVGNIGAPGRINYTIVGDAVNVGQRLELLGKTLSRGEAVTILISQATADALDDTFLLEPAGEVMMKGRQHPVQVYRLLAEPAHAGLMATGLAGPPEPLKPEPSGAPAQKS